MGGDEQREAAKHHEQCRVLLAIRHREVDDIGHRPDKAQRLVRIDALNHALHGARVREWIAGHPDDEIGGTSADLG